MNKNQLIEQINASIEERVNEFDAAAMEYLEIKENNEDVLITGGMTFMQEMSEDISKLLHIRSRIKDNLEALEYDEETIIEEHEENCIFEMDVAAMDYQDFLTERSFEEVK